MQSRRATVPELVPVAAVASLAGRPGLLIADRTGSTPAELGRPRPEGGLSPEELGALGDVPRLAVGRFVLRAQSAPLAVVAALLAGRTGVPDVVN